MSTIALLISLLFENTIYFCFCTNQSSTGARLNSFASEQSNLKNSWKLSKDLRILLTLNIMQLCQLDNTAELVE